jgi:hypothetical protein
MDNHLEEKEPLVAPSDLTDVFAATVERDAARYRWLKERLLGADFDWNESGVTVLAFEFPRNIGIGGNCDKNIDAAMAANVELSRRPTPNEETK